MKSVLKGALVGIVSVSFFVGCSPKPVEVVTQPVTQSVTKPIALTPSFEEKSLVESTLANFRKSFPGREVGLDEEFKIFYVVLTIPEASVIVDASKGDYEALAETNALFYQFDLLSETIGRTLPGYSIALTNPVDTTLHFYVAKDGRPLYNVLND